jgi:hypothetical protein
MREKRPLLPMIYLPHRHVRIFGCTVHITEIAHALSAFRANMALSGDTDFLNSLTQVRQKHVEQIRLTTRRRRLWKP